MNKPRLSKTKLLAFRQCPKRLWLEVHRPDLKEESEQMLWRFEVGHAVGDIARTLVPDGRLIGHPEDVVAAIAETRQALLEEPKRTLFEPAFQHEGLLVRADILFNPAGRARLVEVKSSTRVKDYHFEDAAIQTHVLSQAGIAVKETRLAYVDKHWDYPGGNRYSGLLTQEDVTSEIRPLMKEVPRWLKDAQGVVAGSEPKVETGKHCGKPFECSFQRYCTGLAGPQADYPVSLLPGSSGKSLARKLSAAGYEDLRIAPVKLIPKGQFRRIHRATVTGKPVLGRSARAEITKLAYPRYYLDFETINPAVPTWAGTRPYRITCLLVSGHDGPKRVRLGWDLCGGDVIYRLRRR